MYCIWGTYFVRNILVFFYGNVGVSPSCLVIKMKSIKCREFYVHFYYFIFFCDQINENVSIYNRMKQGMSYNQTIFRKFFTNALFIPLLQLFYIVDFT